jgi:membrane protease YdiL (CAAX protease family)
VSRLNDDETSASPSCQAQPDLPVLHRHQLAAIRNAGYFAAFLVALFLIWTIRATWLYSIDENIDSLLLRAIYSSAVKCALWMVPAIAFARYVRRTSPAEYLGLKRVPTIQQQFLCCAITSIYLGTVAAFEFLFGGKSVSVAPLAELSITVLVLQQVLSPFMEEVFFRGLILKELLTLLRPLGAVIVNSLLFAAIHLPFWLTHDRVDRQLVMKTVGVFVFSLFAAGLYVRTKSVWPSVAAHIANNLMSAMLISAPE